MAFNKPSVKPVKTDISDMTIYLRTLKKFGKTTLFRDVVMEKFGDPSYGMLAACGPEIGYELISNLNSTHIKTWQDAVDMKKWLISQKGKEHNIKIVCYDVVDELIPMVETEVVRLSNIENPKKPCKSIKGAFGGYNAGPEMAQQMLKQYFLDLRNAGFGLWALAHTKFKNVKQKGDLDDGYMNLSSTLNSTYEGVFGDIFDFVLTGYIDRMVETEEVEVGGNTKKVGHATDAIRKLYFRGTTLVDAGCRIGADLVPEYLVFDKQNMAKDFINLIESAAKGEAGNAMNTFTAPIVQNQTVADQTDSISDEVVDMEDDTIIEENSAEDLVAMIRQKFKTADKDIKLNVKKAIKEAGFTSLSTDMPVDILENINGML